MTDKLQLLHARVVATEQNMQAKQVELERKVNLEAKKLERARKEIDNQKAVNQAKFDETNRLIDRTQKSLSADTTQKHELLRKTLS